ncbi:hypothetical protein CYJ41_01490 [Campylobacter ureolyticus]|uniref:PBP domain-containing protein n=1 Tax=Campylobacter ureolyticus TaxID=827 RepID=A0A2I1NCN9_9BACT|nr:phosphate ABC transporter substrate-binding protein PstS [Campylobacter ureolyticus]PKZ30141.1 hypothetical protein CYJ41_01490 [Campylobacter ureolyticus]
MIKKIVKFVFIFLCANLINAYELKGYGATFAGSKVIEISNLYETKTKNKISYLPIGSSGGIKQILLNRGDFAVVDIAFKDDSLEFVSFIKSAVSISYNLPNISNLILTPDLVAKIFTGEIQFWDDDNIKNLNPNLNLPKEKIIFFHRYDGSGTTFTISSFLDISSKFWNLGSHEFINFKIGIGKKGNRQLAKAIAQTPYSIGYTSYYYAKNLNSAFLKYKNLILHPQDEAYPVQNFSYFIYKKESPKKEDIENFIKFTKQNYNPKDDRLSYFE